MITLPDFLSPQLGLGTQAFIRIAYGVLLLGTLLRFLPHRGRFFLSERWGGYAKSSWNVDLIQNPIGYAIIMTFWLASAVLITLNWWATWAALVNLLFCRYFFIHMRWKGIARGMGAPGFMTYWLAAAVFLLEYTSHYATTDLRALALLVLQVDFAFIMLSAGIYKFTAGYPRNEGMELGMVNQEWGYWWKFYIKLPPAHWIIKTLNQLAWSTEVVAAILMLLPPTRFIGALLIILSFVFIATQIRLGLLCEMVMLCGALYFQGGGEDALRSEDSASRLNWVNEVLEGLLWAYLILLPLAHAGLFYNFYGRKSLPGFLQRVLVTYTNFFGIIIWRVFSVDVVNFFIRIYEQKPDGERALVSRYGWGGSWRYNDVCESITVTSLFTTLKYYPGNSDLFTERLLRYAHTVPCPVGSMLVFEYISIRKTACGFALIPVAEYIVDPSHNSVKEETLEETFSVRNAHRFSPVHEGVQPGSYAPLKG